MAKLDIMSSLFASNLGVIPKVSPQGQIVPAPSKVVVYGGDTYGTVISKEAGGAAYTFTLPGAAGTAGQSLRCNSSDPRQQEWYTPAAFVSGGDGGGEDGSPVVVAPSGGGGEPPDQNGDIDLSDVLGGVLGLFPSINGTMSSGTTTKAWAATNSRRVGVLDAESSAIGIEIPSTGVTSYTVTLPAAVGATDQSLRTSNGTGSLEWFDAVEAPASSTDEAIVRFDGTTGQLIQNSAITVSNTGDIVPTTTGQRVGLTSAQWNSVVSRETILYDSTGANFITFNRPTGGANLNITYPSDSCSVNETLATSDISGTMEWVGLQGGEYTPTFSSESNLASVTSLGFWFQRVGDTITVTGSAQFTVGVSGSLQLGTVEFTLPVDRINNFTTTSQLRGGAVSAVNSTADSGSSQGGYLESVSGVKRGKLYVKINTADIAHVWIAGFSYSYSSA
jgi:hypothetical protein